MVPPPGSKTNATIPTSTINADPTCCDEFTLLLLLLFVDRVGVGGRRISLRLVFNNPLAASVRDTEDASINR